MIDYPAQGELLSLATAHKPAKIVTAGGGTKQWDDSAFGYTTVQAEIMKLMDKVWSGISNERVGWLAAIESGQIASKPPDGLSNRRRVLRMMGVVSYKLVCRHGDRSSRFSKDHRAQIIHLHLSAPEPSRLGILDHYVYKSWSEMSSKLSKEPNEMNPY